MIWHVKCMIFQGIIALTAPFAYIPVVFALPIKEEKDKTTTPPTNKLRHHGTKHLREWRLENIKQDIMKQLEQESRDMQQPTRTSAAIQENRRVIKNYRKSLQDFKWDVHTLYEKEERTPDTYNRFIDDGTRPSELPKSNHSTLQLYFPVNIPSPDDPYKEVVVRSAKLKLNIISVSPNEIHDSTDDHMRINVHQITSDVTSGVLDRKLVDSRRVSLQSTGWLEFDIRTAVEDWTENPNSNLGLEISCDHKRDNIKNIFNLFYASTDYEGDIYLFEDFLPYVTVLSHEKDILGKPRNSRDASLECSPGESRCCRVPITVDFREIGYDFVEEPRTFPAYYCSGWCPTGYREAHDFAAVQLILSKLRPSDVPAPCCAPSEFRDLPYLRYQNGLLVEEVFTNMIVAKCMCT